MHSEAGEGRQASRQACWEYGQSRMGQNSKEVSVFLARSEKGGKCRKEEGKVEEY